MLNKMEKGLFGGAMISLGSFTYLIVQQKTNNAFLASMCFFLGLLLIMVFNQHLYTGQVFSKSNLKSIDYTVTLINTWVLNFFGAIIATILLNQILYIDISKIITTKLSLSPLQITISAIFCNLLVCSAVAGYKITKNIFISGFFIMCFVLCGFEHVIASMTYIILGQLQDVSMTLSSIISYLICASLGNFIGGRLVVILAKTSENE
jgi:nitrite transporter NirC